MKKTFVAISFCISSMLQAGPFGEYQEVPPVVDEPTDWHTLPPSVRPVKTPEVISGGGYQIVPPKAFATVSSHQAVMSGSQDRVDELCPETSEVYTQKLDEYQRAIDAFDGSPWPHYIIAQVFRDARYPVELCAEMKIIKASYDMVLATSLLATENTKREVTLGLDDLNACLKAATRRNELENCYISFRSLINKLLGL